MIFQRSNVLGVAKRYLFNNFRSAAMSSQTPAAKKLDGKVAIVTASTDGIGFAIARKLAIDGAQVVVSSRKQNNVDKAVSLLEKEGLKVFGMPCHVGSKNDREKLINETAERFGGIDILVSNAAVNPTFGNILDCTEEIWDKIFEINVKSAFLLVKSVVPHMEKRGGGSIVLVSSIAGFQPITALGAYSVSKTALLGLTKALAMQLGPDNIRVNCLAPGIVQTKFSGALVDDQTIRSRMEEQIPLRRIAQPNEMGGLVSFLCSEDASYITGENILVCGGMPSRL